MTLSTTASINVKTWAEEHAEKMAALVARRNEALANYRSEPGFRSYTPLQISLTDSTERCTSRGRKAYLENIIVPFGKFKGLTLAQVRRIPKGTILFRNPLGPQHPKAPWMKAVEVAFIEQKAPMPGDILPQHDWRKAAQEYFEVYGYPEGKSPQSAFEECFYITISDFDGINWLDWAVSHMIWDKDAQAFRHLVMSIAELERERKWYDFNRDNLAAFLSLPESEERLNLSISPSVKVEPSAIHNRVLMSNVFADDMGPRNESSSIDNSKWHAHGSPLWINKDRFVDDDPTPSRWSLRGSASRINSTDIDDGWMPSMTEEESRNWAPPKPLDPSNHVELFKKAFSLLQRLETVGGATTESFVDGFTEIASVKAEIRQHFSVIVDGVRKWIPECKGFDTGRISKPRWSKLLTEAIVAAEKRMQDWLADFFTTEKVQLTEGDLASAIESFFLTEEEIAAAKASVTHQPIKRQLRSKCRGKRRDYSTQRMGRNLIRCWKRADQTPPVEIPLIDFTPEVYQQVDMNVKPVRIASPWKPKNPKKRKTRRKVNAG